MNDGKIKKLITQLFNQKWRILHGDIDYIDFIDHPGVYLLAFSYKNLENTKIKISDVFYVGMSNSRGGVKQRLKRFINGLEKDDFHSAARRFYDEYANQKPFSKLKTKKKFYFAFISIPCEVSKDRRTPKDLRKMGDIAQLEYYILAYIKEKLDKEPDLNKK